MKAKKVKKSNLAFNLLSQIGTPEDEIEMYSDPDCPYDILLDGATRWSKIKPSVWNENIKNFDPLSLYSAQAISAILANPNISQEVYDIILNSEHASLNLKSHPYSKEVKEYIESEIQYNSQGVIASLSPIFSFDKMFLSGSSMVYFLKLALGASKSYLESTGKTNPFIHNSNLCVLKDLDFFFKEESYLKEFLNLIIPFFIKKDPENKFEIILENGKIKTKGATFIPGEFKIGNVTFEGGISKNAISIKNCQFIIRSFGTPEEIVSEFDFYHCQAYFDFSTKKISFPSKFLRSIQSGKLLYNSNCKTYPINSLQRIFKFAERGWSLPKYQLLKIVQKLLSKDINDGLSDNLDGYYTEIDIDSDISTFNELLERISEQVLDIEKD